MMKNSSRRSGIGFWLSLVALLFFVAPGTRAQGEVQNEEGGDPPSRVARISFLDGSVSLQPGGTGEWGSASINRPVTIGDKLWTDQNSRLELQAGEVSIHLGGMTALSFLNLDGNATQMRLAEGRINFRVREIREGDLNEVDTPNLAFTVKQAGAFRIDVNENGDETNVTVIRGEGEVAAGGQTYTVHAGERATVAGTDSSVQYTAHAAPLNPDDLDRWAEQRDLKEEDSASAKYVSRETVGYSDLDDYGTWNEEPNYGNVWYPNSVSPDWAPYSNGYWNWVGPWGWTWVDYSPWGFAPYHYGRWIYGGGRWGWCPGPIYARPYYGPAFVGFLSGFNVGIGFGFGVGVGWFPLGWGEPYRPWYHCGGGYWNNINVHNTNIRNVNAINRNSVNNYNYAYAHNTRAVTVASQSAFSSSQAIHRNASQVNQSMLRNAHVTSNVNATPSRASMLGASNIHGRVATPSSTVQNRAVVARTTPAASASHLPVRTMNTSALTPGRYNGSTTSKAHMGSASPANNHAGVSGATTGAISRQEQIASNRPPSARPQGGFAGNSNNGENASRSSSARTWSAQGNATDSGRAPQGFGGNSQPTGHARTTQMNQVSRPPWDQGNGSGNSSVNSRASVNRPPASYYNNNRTYRPPSANLNHGTSAPRTYNPSAPRNYGGGGGSHPNSRPSGGGGGHPSGGGGGSHPSGGGGGGHPHR